MRFRYQPGIIIGAAGGLLCAVLLLCFWLSHDSPEPDTVPADAIDFTIDGRTEEAPGESRAASGFGHVEGKVLFQGQERKWPPNGRELSDVIVYLKGSVIGTKDAAGNSKQAPQSPDAAEKKTTEQATAVLDQFDMTFVPHVVMMRKGGTLELRNSDSTLHNVNGHAKVNQSFNVALSPGGKTEVSLRRPEFFRVVCNFHSRMSAWVAVMPNSFFTRVSDDGRFTLKDVPAGNYSLAGWHEDIYPPYTPKAVSTKIRVEPGKTTVVTLDFP